MDNENSTDASDISHAIFEFCRRKLSILQLADLSVDFADGCHFQSLKELKLERCTINNFCPPPTLKTLILDESTKFNNLDWMSHTYPNLTRIQSCNGIENLNNAVLIAFQAANPQLQKFYVQSFDITSSILQGISTRLPNLVELTVFFRSNPDAYTNREVENDLSHLSGLRQLRRLRCNQQMGYFSVVGDLADNNIPIEDLEILGLNPCIAENIGRLTSLRKLRVQKLNFGMVIDHIIKLPTLQHLTTNECEHISLNGVKRILEMKTNLKSLEIGDLYMQIDSDSLMGSIMELARGRIKMKLLVANHNIHISLQPYRHMNVGNTTEISSPRR